MLMRLQTQLFQPLLAVGGVLSVSLWIGMPAIASTPIVRLAQAPAGTDPTLPGGASPSLPSSPDPSIPSGSDPSAIPGGTTAPSAIPTSPTTSPDSSQPAPSETDAAGQGGIETSAADCVPPYSGIVKVALPQPANGTRGPVSIPGLCQKA
jgi:hypothetical protein